MEINTVQLFLNTVSSVLLFLTVVFLFLKLSVIPINSIYKKAITIVIGCLLVSIAYNLIYFVNSTFAQIASYWFPSLFFIFFEKKSIALRIVTCFLLTCITRLLMIIPAFIVSITISTYFPNYFLYPLIYVLTFICSAIFVKIKRFRKGIQFFEDEKSLGVGIAISGIIYFLLCITFAFDHVTDILTFFVFSGILITAVGLYLWIRRSITSHYREKLQLQSEEHYQQLLAESEAKNEELMKSNEFLAKLVHRDNHLINALNTSIDDYFNSDDKEFKDNLFREIQTLAKERGELLAQEQSTLKLLPSTGNRLIDGAINNLYIKATAHGIDFDLAVTEPVDTIIGKYISQTELQTLLCDHIKDAIIAVVTKGEGSDKILVSLSVKDNNYDITIFDSGVDFEIDTLSKLGMERVTTHADNGGNGIGFMTTFETLKKAYASLIITEIENKTPFSKSVSFRFDGLSSFVIQSYRADELKSAINREDTIIV